MWCWDWSLFGCMHSRALFSSLAPDTLSSVFVLFWDHTHSNMQVLFRALFSGITPVGALSLVPSLQPLISVFFNSLFCYLVSYRFLLVTLILFCLLVCKFFCWESEEGRGGDSARSEAITNLIPFNYATSWLSAWVRSTVVLRAPPGLHAVVLPARGGCRMGIQYSCLPCMCARPLAFPCSFFKKKFVCLLFTDFILLHCTHWWENLILFFFLLTIFPSNVQCFMTGKFLFKNRIVFNLYKCTTFLSSFLLLVIFIFVCEVGGNPFWQCSRD